VRILLVQRFDIHNVSCARRATAFARELDRRGHRVTLVNFPHPQRREELPQLSVSLPKSVEILDLKREGTAFLSNLRILTQRARNADLIHLWKCYPDAALPALHAARRAKKPIHYDWDDWEVEITRELTRSGLASHLVRFLEHRVPRMADTVSVASAELRRQAINCGVPENRIWDAPVGADLETFRPGRTQRTDELESDLWPTQTVDRTPVLVYVGQLEVATFVELALAVVAKLRQPVRLLVVGGGSQLKELKIRTWSMGITNRVTFTDYVPEDRVPDYVSLADVALAPFEDTMVTRCKSPLKVVEYMAAGLPVVGSHVGEVPHMLAGCGITVPPGDTGAMAEAVSQLLGDEARKNELGRLARRRAEELFSWNRIVDNLLEAFQTGIDSYPPA
jgi:glycosyltransferase involved in cell wall biosynthesis